MTGGDGVLRDGELALAISTAVVRELASISGRGPMRAKATRATTRFVVLQDTLTRGERNVVDAGESNALLDLRRLWQKVMRSRCSQAIEDLTGVPGRIARAVRRADLMDHVSHRAARSEPWSPPCGAALAALVLVSAGSAGAGLSVVSARLSFSSLLFVWGCADG